MAIFYIGKEPRQDGNFTVLSPSKGKKMISQIFERRKDRLIGLDYETTGLCPIKNDTLLLAVGDPTTQVVIDCCEVNPYKLFPHYWNKFRFIGMNIKFDWTMAEANEGVKINHIYDVMIAAQRLNQNLPVRFNLNELITRFLGVDYPLDKDITREFVGQDPRTFVPTAEQIEYAAHDVKYLHPLKYRLDAELKKAGMFWFVDEVEMNLIKVLGQAENDGFPIDVDLLEQIIVEEDENAFNRAVELDKEIQRVGAKVLNRDKIYRIKGDKFTRKRNVQKFVEQKDLFGNTIEAGYRTHSGARQLVRPMKLKKNTGNINYNSELQIIEVFGRLNQVLPTKDHLYLVPYIKDNGKADRNVGIDDDGYEVNHEGFETNQKSLTKMLVDIPDHPMKHFIDLLFEYSVSRHRVDSFGINLRKKVNPISGNLHTIFGQCKTANGRLSSGDSRSYPDRTNMQNFPRDKRFRKLLKARPGYKIATADLSGAEVTIMCDKAHDEKLYQWAVKNDDAHSPIVMNSWRMIYLYRCLTVENKVNSFYGFLKFVKRLDRAKKIAKNYRTKAKTEEGKKFAELACTFVVSKKVNKPYRQGGKNNTFGSVYGMKPSKAAETYNGTTAELRKIDHDAEPVNVTEEEGKVALWAIKQAIPKTFEYVEGNVQKALQQGYLVISERSGTRIWFMNVVQIIRAIKSTIKENGEGHLLSVSSKGEYTLSTGEVFNLDWKELKDISGQARNVPISGMQADMLKEMMVEIDNEIKKNNWDVHFKLQVHDELVYEFPENMEPIPFRKDNSSKVEIISFPEWLTRTMSNIANRYLKHYKMKCEVEVHDTWIK